MTPTKANFKFHFVTQVSLTQITNARAKNLLELLNHLKTADGSVIHHHTHRFLKQHQFLSPEPPNDFSYWVNTSLQDEMLAEKLASIDIIRFRTIHELKENIVQTIETHIEKNPNDRNVNRGSEFHFMQTIGFIVPTHYQVWTLKEFADALKKVSINSIYHHIFEARLRHESATNDFSWWLGMSMGEKELAESIARMDPYTQTLEGLRERIIGMIEKRIKETKRGPSK